MMLLPKKIGPFTLMRKLGTDGVTESYAGILDEPAGKQVVIRRILPYVARDAARMKSIEARVADLRGVRHPVLVPVLDWVEAEDEHFLVEERIEAVNLEQLLDWARQERRSLPHNIYLNLATQICNGLEALHGRPGKESGAENVLHMAMRPAAVYLDAEGRLLVGDFGLVRSPTSLPHGGVAGPVPATMEYLSPEQTHPEQDLSPASDVFALGAILYELLTLKPLFKQGSNLQTIHAVRRAEVTQQLLEVKEILPGLDKVLYRALSLNPRHRYQRAFVLREDIRGLMAGYSFANIAEETRRYLAPLFLSSDDHGQALGDSGLIEESTASLLRNVSDPAPSEAENHTFAFLLPPSTVGDTKGPDTLVPDNATVMPDLEETTDAVEPSPSDDKPTDHTGWIQGKPRAPEASPVSGTPPREVTDHTSWIPTGGAQPASPPAATSEAPPAPSSDHTSWVRRDPKPASSDEFADVPTDVRHDPRTPVTEERPRSADPANVPQATQDATGGLAESVPPPPKRQPNEVPPSVPAAATYVDDEDDDWRPRKSKAPLILGILGGVVVLALLGVVVVGALGLAGAGLWASNGTPGSEEPTIATAVTETPAVSSTIEADPASATGPETTSSDPEATASGDATPSSSTTEPVAPSASTPAVAAASTPVRTEPVVARTGAPSSSSSSGGWRPSTTTPPTRDTTSGFRRPTPTPTFVEDLEPAPLASSGLDDGDLLESAPATPSTLDELSGKAKRGQLSESERAELLATAATDPSWERARTLLYEDAKSRGDLRSQRTHLDALMARPENQYDPVLLVEQAQISIARKDYKTALDRANLAERYWQRIPSDLIFTRKAMIYEAQAASYQGMFYASGGEDMDALRRAIGSWQTYERHVNTKARTDLVEKARVQLAKLEDARRRLE